MNIAGAFLAAQVRRAQNDPLNPVSVNVRCSALDRGQCFWGVLNMRKFGRLCGWSMALSPRWLQRGSDFRPPDRGNVFSVEAGLVGTLQCSKSALS